MRGLYDVGPIGDLCVSYMNELKFEKSMRILDHPASRGGPSSYLLTSQDAVIRARTVPGVLGPVLEGCTRRIRASI